MTFHSFIWCSADAGVFFLVLVICLTFYGLKDRVRLNFTFTIRSRCDLFFVEIRGEQYRLNTVHQHRRTRTVLPAPCLRL